MSAVTGVLTRELVVAAVSAEVTATDLNEAMVDFGRIPEPGAVWRRADALHLPFGDGEFDMIACQFGVMFFPDEPAAFAAARRVLPVNGKMLLNTWAALDAHDFQAALVAALDRVLPEDPPTFMVSVPHGYSDTDAVVADLAAGGFRCVSVESISLEGQAASAAEVAAGYCMGTPLRVRSKRVATSTPGPRSWPRR